MNKNKTNAVLVGSSLGFRTDMHKNFEVIYLLTKQSVL